MSFKGATAGFSIDERKTTLHLIGGRDCVPGAPMGTYTPDLWVRGGTAVEKSLCVLGNINTEGMLIGNVCSDIAMVETLSEKFMGEGVTVMGNLIFDSSSTLVAQSITTNNITANGDVTINPSGDLILKPEGNIDLCAGDLSNVTTIFGGGNGLVLDPGADNFVTVVGQGINLSGGDICDVDVLKANTLAVAGVTANVFNTTTINGVETIFGSGDLLFCTNGDIEIKPMNGNLILHNTTLAFDLNESILSNVSCVQAGPGNDLELKTDDAHKVVISAGGGLDMMGRPICNAGNVTISDIQTDTIASMTSLLLCATDEVEIKSNGAVNISTGGGINLFSGNVCDVGTLKTTNLETVVPGSKICVTAGEGIDLKDRDLGNVGLLEVNQITSTNNVIDFLCNDIDQVAGLELANLRAKDSGCITVEDSLLLEECVAVQFELGEDLSFQDVVALDNFGRAVLAQGLKIAGEVIPTTELTGWTSLRPLSSDIQQQLYWNATYTVAGLTIPNNPVGGKNFPAAASSASDSAIVKTTPDGTVVWANSIRSTAGAYALARVLRSDVEIRNNLLYVIYGRADNTVELRQPDGSLFATIAAGAVVKDVLLLKIDAITGYFLDYLVIAADDPASRMHIFDFSSSPELTVDKNGDIWFAGQWGAPTGTTITIDAATGGSIVRTASNGYGVVVPASAAMIFIKFNSDLKAYWVNTVASYSTTPGAGNDCIGLCVGDDGDGYAVVTNEADSSNPPVVTLTLDDGSMVPSGISYLRLNSATGNVVWLQNPSPLGYPTSRESQSPICARNGSVYVAFENRTNAVTMPSGATFAGEGVVIARVNPVDGVDTVAQCAITPLGALAATVPLDQISFDSDNNVWFGLYSNSGAISYPGFGGDTPGIDGWRLLKLDANLNFIWYEQREPPFVLSADTRGRTIFQSAWFEQLEFQPIGLMMETGLMGERRKVCVGGVFSGGSFGVGGDTFYNKAGQLSTDTYENVKMGLALGTTRLYIDIQPKGLLTAPGSEGIALPEIYEDLCITDLTVDTIVSKNGVDPVCIQIPQKWFADTANLTVDGVTAQDGAFCSGRVDVTVQENVPEVPVSVQASTVMGGPTIFLVTNNPANPFYQSIVVSTTFKLGTIRIFSNNSGGPITVRLYEGIITSVAPGPVTITPGTLLASDNAVFANSPSYTVDFSSFDLTLIPGTYTVQVTSSGPFLSWTALNGVTDPLQPVFTNFSGSYGSLFQVELESQFQPATVADVALEIPLVPAGATTVQVGVDLDMKCNNLANVGFIEVQMIESKAGNLQIQDNVDLSGVLCAPSMTTDLMTSKSGGNITLDSDVDITGTLFVETISGKSPIDVVNADVVNFRDGDIDMFQNDVLNVDLLTLQCLQSSTTPIEVSQTDTLIGASSLANGAGVPKYQTFVVTEPFRLTKIRYFTNGATQNFPITLELREGALSMVGFPSYLPLIQSVSFTGGTSATIQDVDYTPFDILLSPGSYTFGWAAGANMVWSYTNTTTPSLPSILNVGFFPHSDTWLLEVFGTGVSTIGVKDGLDLFCNDVGNVAVLEVGNIVPKNADGTIYFNGNVVVMGNVTATNVSGGGGGPVVLPSPTASVFRVDIPATGTQMISSGSTPTVVLMTTEHPQNINEPGTWNGSDTFTVTVAGWYDVTGAVDFGTSIDNKFGVQVLINDANTDTFGQHQLYSTAADALAQIHSTVYLEAADTVKLAAFQTTGVAQTVERAFLSIVRTAPDVAYTNFVDADVVCADLLQVDTIEPKGMLANVTIDGNLDVGETLYVSTISGKSPITMTDDLVLQGDITFKDTPAPNDVLTFTGGVWQPAPTQVTGVSSVSAGGVLSLLGTPSAPVISLGGVGAGQLSALFTSFSGIGTTFSGGGQSHYFGMRYAGIGNWTVYVVNNFFFTASGTASTWSIVGTMGGGPPTASSFPPRQQTQSHYHFGENDHRSVSVSVDQSSITMRMSPTQLTGQDLNGSGSFGPILCNYWSN